MTQTDHAQNVRKLADLIKDIRVAMLTTAGDDGSLRSRPMATQQDEFAGVLWFFTKSSAPKVGEVERHREVNVSYAEPGRQHYVSVSGRAEVVRDRDKLRELWHPLLKAWFPQGLDDPDLALVRVEPTRAEFWDAPSSTMVHLVGFVKALATGQTYRPGENQKISLG